MTGKTLLAAALAATLLTSCSSNGGGTAQQATTQPQAAQPPAQQNPYTPPADTFTPPATTTTAPARGSGSAKTVRIEGKDYTCDQLIGSIANEPCSPQFNAAYEKWGDHIDDYVNSGHLGPLGNQGNNSVLSYEVLSFLGLYACILNESDGTSTDFVNYGLKIHPDAARTDFLPLWFNAPKYLCTELPAKG
ncbi:hypothetical protein G9E11_15330 [Arthrobacter sp. IA7]|uniref:hypothetical protein n=1 Tax=Arthrobacter ipis TaxID=2716202 RepID=UPI0016894A7D|nr:hypothetical protein [Arthrobacter ipis]MBD1543583.1 hypothetical protein [Arthrobacter ipis]